jgi:hypothetical protein
MFVLDSSRRTLVVPSFGTRRKPAVIASGGMGPGQANIDRHFFSALVPRNSLISPDSGKQREIKGNKKEGLWKRLDAQRKLLEGMRKETVITE